MMTAFWCLQVNGDHSPGEAPQIDQTGIGRILQDIIQIDFDLVGV